MCSFVQSKIFHYCEYKQFKHWYLNGDKRKCRLFRPLRHTATILLGKEVTVRFLPVQGSAGMAYRLSSSPAATGTNRRSPARGPTTLATSVRSIRRITARIGDHKSHRVTRTGAQHDVTADVRPTPSRRGLPVITPCPASTVQKYAACVSRKTLCRPR